MIKLGSIVALFVAVLALVMWADAPVQAGEECVTYSFSFVPPEEPQLYADQAPGFRTASEAGGQTVSPGTYDVVVIYGDDNPWQMQPWEVAHVEAGGVASNSTPDVPDDPDGMPGEWLWYKANLGEITTTTPFTTVNAVHTYYRQVKGPNSLSVALVELSYCYQETPTPTNTVTGTTPATETVPATETIPAITPTPSATLSITPTVEAYNLLLLPLIAKYPTLTPTVGPTATPFLTPTPPPTPLAPAGARINLEVWGGVTPAEGVYRLIEITTGRTLMAWHAQEGWQDSGCSWFEISHTSKVEVRVDFTYSASGETVNLTILNSPFVERGICHAIEVAFS